MYLPNVFSDHAVLQRGVPLPVWGWADTGRTVTVRLGAQTRSTTAPPGGRWRVVFDPLEVGDPLTLHVDDGTESITRGNLVAGDVWLCGGQSNMQFTLARATTGAAALASADLPGLRLLNVPIGAAAEPHVDVDAAWKVCTPEIAGAFSAVGFFFGRRLHLSEGVPIGLIGVAVGGSTAPAWLPRAVLESEPHLRVELDHYDFARAHYFQSVQAGRQIDLGTGQPPAPPATKNQPAGMFNAMIAPLIPFALRGVIWYQGEADVWRAQWYHTLFTTLIRSWRQRWGLGDFPFLFVQLPNHDATADGQRDPRWAELREAQARTLTMANTAMAVAIDLGQPAHDLHPPNKEPVGARLAAVALWQVYGRKVAAIGPTYRAHRFEGNAARVRFDHAQGLRTRDGESPRCFSLAGGDGTFVPAEARIAGDGVVVRSERIADPVAVRYAWESNPKVNLVNEADLPAAPFRSDDWPRVSAETR